MKPHRRKDTPPRRDSDQGGEPAPDQVPEAGPEQAPAPEQPQAPEAGDAAYQEVEQPVYDPNAVQYDPGQALVDPGASYPETSAPADPGQAYVDPAQPPQPDPAGYPAPPPVAEGAGVYDEIPAQQQPAPAPAPQQPATPSRPASPRRPAGRRPAAGARRPKSRYQRPKTVSYGGGISVMTVFLTLVALAMLGIVAMVMMPKDLSTVKGYPVNPLSNETPANLLDQAQRVMIDREKAITFSEEDVNAYLNHRLQGEQGGAISALVKFKGVYVDFTPEHAEVIIEREIFGMPVTMSSKIRAEKFRRQVLYKSAGWSLGKIEFNSRNIKPVIEMFMRLRKTCMEEFTTMKQMADVRFEQDALVLDSSI